MNKADAYIYLCVRKHSPRNNVHVVVNHGLVEQELGNGGLVQRSPTDAVFTKNLGRGGPQGPEVTGVDLRDEPGKLQRPSVPLLLRNSPGESCDLAFDQPHLRLGQAMCLRMV